MPVNRPLIPSQVTRVRRLLEAPGGQAMLFHIHARPLIARGLVEKVDGAEHKGPFWVCRLTPAGENLRHVLSVKSPQ